MPAGSRITIKDKGLFYLGLLNVVLRDALFLVKRWQIIITLMEQDEIV